MIRNSYKLINSKIIMLNRSNFTCINIRKVRPTILTIISLIINNKIITKSRPIIFMHADSKLSFIWYEFSTSELFSRWDKKTLLFEILLVHPVVRRLPWKHTISNHNITILCFCNCHSVRHAIAFFMELWCWKFACCCPVQQMYVVYLFL